MIFQCSQLEENPPEDVTEVGKMHTRTLKWYFYSVKQCRMIIESGHPFYFVTAPWLGITALANIQLWLNENTFVEFSFANSMHSCPIRFWPASEQCCVSHYMAFPPSIFNTACSSFASIGFLGLPPTFQKHACQVHWRLKIIHKWDCECHWLFVFMGPAIGWQSSQGCLTINQLQLSSSVILLRINNIEEGRMNG